MNLLRNLFTILLSIGFLGSLMQEAVAQVNPKVQVWNFGKVFLANGDTLSGTLTYYRQEEVIKIDPDQVNSYTFSPVNINGFLVREESQLIYRQFRTFLWNRNNDPYGYRSPALFEYLQEGTYSLLKRETYMVLQNTAGRIAAREIVPFPIPIPVPRESVHIVEMFYVVGPDNKIIPLKKPEKDLPALFGPKAGQMKDFVKENKLSYRNETDLKAIIRYYNSLL